MRAKNQVRYVSGTEWDYGVVEFTNPPSWVWSITRRVML